MNEVVKQFSQACANNGQHDLTEIFRIETEGDVEAVVVHCDVCGAVAVNRETDNRLMGQYVKMRFPRATTVLRALLDETNKKAQT